VSTTVASRGRHIESVLVNRDAQHLLVAKPSAILVVWYLAGSSMAFLQATWPFGDRSIHAFAVFNPERRSHSTSILIQHEENQNSNGVASYSSYHTSLKHELEAEG